MEILLTQLALRVPERAEYRLKASLAIVDLMRGLSGALFNRVVRWFFMWAHSEKVSHRQFAIEVMGRLMQESEREDVDGGDDVIVEETEDQVEEEEAAVQE